jgi:GH18 family chitinase
MPKMLLSASGVFADLHSQWDYGNANADDGCVGGNCLRTQVNWTETQESLAMLTKAGVPSSQIVVGVTSYGRSFQMTTPGCYGPDCTYTSAGGAPGKCTATSGYLANAEINQIISTDSSAQVINLDDDLSSILIYDSDQWVSYMTDDQKSQRSSWSPGVVLQLLAPAPILVLI